MKPRTTLILAAVLIVLAGIALLFQTSRKKSLDSPGKPIFAAYNADKADGIDIQGKGKTVQLRKKNDAWVVATEGWHAADPKVTKQILDALSDFTTGNLISTAKEKQATFEVDSTGFTMKVLQSGKTVAEFIVGKPGPDYMSAYIRPVRENKVYLVPSALRSMVDRGDTWRNTMVLDLDPANITSFTATNPKGTVAGEKDATGNWKITQPYSAPGKPDVMSAVVRSLGQIRASGFADSMLTAEAAGLSPDTTKIEIKASDGSTHTVVVGAMNDRRQSYTRIDSDPTIYLVPRGRFSTIFRDPNTMRGEELPPTPPQQP